MARVILFRGPQPPEGQTWCAICMGTSKQAVIENHAAEIRAAAREADTMPPLILAVGKADGPHGLHPAITRTVSPAAPMLGPVDCCWSHGAALDMTAHAIQPAAPGQVAALGGGVPLR